MTNSALAVGSRTKLWFLNAERRSPSGSTARYRFYTVNYSQMLTNALLTNGEGRGDILSQIFRGHNIRFFSLRMTPGAQEGMEFVGESDA